jgi:hypothetical protein
MVGFLAAGVYPLLAGQSYPIQGTFLNFYRNLTPELWALEFQHMKAVNITTLVIAPVGHLRVDAADPSGYSLAPDGLRYPSNLVPVSKRPKADVLEMMLSLADQQGMQVYLGSLQTAAEWSGGTEFLALRAYNKRVAAEIVQRYGRHRSLAGWYFTQELWLNWAKYYGTRYYGTMLLANWVADMKSLDAGKLTTVAVVVKKTGWGVMPGLTATELETVTTAFLKTTRVEILMPQDGIGAQEGAPALDDLPSYFRAMWQATQATRVAGSNTALWSTIETFTADPHLNNEHFPPATISRIQRQVDRVRPYVSGYVSWIFGDDMSPQAAYYPVEASNLNRQYQFAFKPRTASASEILPLATYRLSLPASASYPDPDLQKLRDRTGGGYSGSDLSSWVGFANNDCDEKSLQITGDLGGTKTIHAVRALTQSQTSSGIFHPSEIDVEVSRDGLNWIPFGTTNSFPHSFPRDTPDFAIAWGEVLGSATGRYVRWTFRYRSWLFLAELEAIGLAKLDSNEPRSVRHLREFQDRSLRSRIGVLPLRAVR